jgi:hypothetical protein
MSSSSLKPPSHAYMSSYDVASDSSQALLGGIGGLGMMGIKIAAAMGCEAGPGRRCSPRQNFQFRFSPCHTMPFNTGNQGSECCSMTRRAMGLEDTWRHGTGCHFK